MTKLKGKIITPEECYDQMVYDFENGQIKGTTTYSKDFDNHWTWRPSELTVLTGYANEGKGTFYKQLCLIKALEENKKFAFYSPEDKPFSVFFDDMIHTLSGQTTDKDRDNLISRKLYDYYFDLIKDKFFFVDIPPPDNTIENILNSFSNIMEKEDLFGLCIDPILKVTTSKNMSERDDKLAAHLGMYCVEYARDNNVCLNITIHQVTPVMDERKMYPIPNLYKVRGGGSLGDGIDNCLFVQRPNYAQDKLDTSVIVGSQKIKKQKLVGVPGAINIQFDRKTNRYKTEDGKDMFNFNKFRP